MSSEFSIAYTQWAALAFFDGAFHEHHCHKVARQALQEGKLSTMHEVLYT